MSEDDANTRPGHLVLDYRLDEPPEKVWRALSVSGLREVWLPAAALADPEPTILAPGQALRYRMREDEPPFLESFVTFRISDEPDGTRLRVIHELAVVSLGCVAAPANGNAPPMLRAA